MKEFFLKVSLQKENIGELILGVLFVLYLVMGYKTPEPLANLVDTVAGKLVLFIMVVYMFMNTHPILAVLALFVVFDLMRRSSLATGIDALEKYAPTEEKKMSQFTAFNQFPYTLEQEVVGKMAPIVQTGSVLNPPSYKPMLENLYDALPLIA
jgi:hypothetical protein